MSEDNADTGSIRISQVASGALAAVTAAVVGSTMGVGGTVAGAGLASVISTVGGSLYLRSIHRTKEHVRTVHAKVIGQSGSATVMVSDEDPRQKVEPGEEVEATTEETPEEETRGEETEETPEEKSEETVDRPPAGKTSGRRRWAAVAATAVAAFVLGMMVVTGVEWVRGEPLSGGSGTTFGSIVDTRQGSDDTEGPSAPTTSTTPPTSSNTNQDPSGATDPTTTTPSPSDATPTTTTAPVDTPTEASPAQESAAASE